MVPWRLINVGPFPAELSDLFTFSCLSGRSQAPVNSEMNTISQHISDQWRVDTESNSPGLCAQLGTELTRFDCQLKDRLTIDKLAAKFLKASIAVRILEIEDPRDLTVKLHTYYTMETNSAKAADPVFEPVNHLRNTSERYLNLSWKVEAGFCKTQEVDVAAKEALSITKEITMFIKSCTRIQPPIAMVLKPLHDLPKCRDLMLEMVHEFMDSGKTEMTLLKAVPIPPKLVIPEATDEELIEEEIELFESTDDMVELEEEAKQFHRVILAGRFQIAREDIDSEITPPMMLTYAKWSTEREPPGKSLFLELEGFWLDEELGKGAEFRIDALFMSDEPTFNEARSAFDLCLKHLPYGSRIKPTGITSLSEVITNITEDRYTQESMKHEHDEIEPLHTHVISRMETTSFYLIDNSVTQKPKFPIILPTSVIPEDDTGVQASEIQITCVINSDVQVNELTDDTYEISKTTTTGHVCDTSMVATKAVTRIDDTQATEVLKHSIDHDLEELMNRKRKKYHGKTSKLPFLNILETQNFDVTEIPTLVDIGESGKRTEDPDSVLTIDDPKLECTNTIGFNSSFISNYQKYLKYMDSNTKLSVVELDLDEDDVEFVISSSCGLLLVDLNIIGQVEGNGLHFLHEKLINCKRRYKDLMVLVACREISRKDSLCSFQLALLLMGIECAVTFNGIKNICEWICEISHCYGEQWPDGSLEWCDTGEAKFLINCGLNAFAAVEVLEQVDIFEFVSMSHAERSRFKFLTSETCEMIHSLFNVEWALTDASRSPAK